MTKGTLVSVNRSDGGVPKLPIKEGHITTNGLAGDRQRDRRFHGGPDRAVCLYSLEVIQALQAEGHLVPFFRRGEFTRLSHKVHPAWGRLYVRVLQQGTVRVGDTVETLAS